MPPLNTQQQFEPQTSTNKKQRIVWETGIWSTAWRMMFQDLRMLATNEKYFFKLARADKSLTYELKNNVAKMLIQIQKRTNTFQDSKGCT